MPPREDFSPEVLPNPALPEDLKCSEIHQYLLREALRCQEGTPQFYGKMLNFWTVIQEANPNHSTPKLKIIVINMELDKQREMKNEASA